MNKIVKNLILASLLIVQVNCSFAVFAQNHNLVNYQFTVKLNLPDHTSQEQKQVRYDIFNRETNEVIYSYRDGSSTEESIPLVEGKYYLRLYYWDSINQSGQVIVDELVQTIADPTEEERTKGKTDRTMYLPGYEQVLADGSVVYDVDFEVKATEYLYDETTQTYKGELTLYLADPLTASENDHPQAETHIDERTNQKETGALRLTVVDNQTQEPIEGSVFDLSGTILETDMNGSIYIEGITAGEYILSVISLPEGYQGEVYENVIIQAQQETNITIPLQATIFHESVAHAVFHMIDQQGNPIPNVGISVNGREQITDEMGNAVFVDLSAGEYQYELTSVPSGFIGQVSGVFGIDPANGNYQTTLTIEKQNETANILFKVMDQQGNPIPDVGIWFLDKMIYTTEDGTVLVNELPLGDYRYETADLPEGYRGVGEGQFSLIAPNESTEIEILLETIPIVTELKVLVKDELGNLVNGAKIIVDDVTLIETNQNGEAIVEALALGEHKLTLSDLPAGYKLEQPTQHVNLLTQEHTVEFILSMQQQMQTINLIVVDQFLKPVENAIISIADKQLITDENGQVLLENVVQGRYTYEVTQLPETFDSSYYGELEVDNDTLEKTIELFRQVKKGTATIKVVNQFQEAIEGVLIRFGGLTGVSDDNGEVYFKELELGNYYYNIVEMPADVTNDNEEKVVQIEEGMNFSDRLTLTQTKIGAAQLVMVNDSGQAIAGITVKINGQSYQTNEQGMIRINELSPGEYIYEIVSDEQYAFKSSTGIIEIKAGETAKLTITGTIMAANDILDTTVTSTTTNNNITVISSQANLKQWIDPTSNIEVWVHPNDVNKVSQLIVQRLNQNLPSRLNNKEADIYSIRLVDNAGNDVVLDHTVQVKIPTRLIHSQVQFVHVSNQQLTTLQHTIHNQRLNFTTQQLGQFAIVYGDRVTMTTQASTTIAANQTVSVATSTGIERRIPNTGESNRLVIVILAIALVGVGGYLVLKKRK